MKDTLDTDHADRLARLEWLAHRMDSAFRIPLIGARVGWDSLLGLIPGVGDVASLGPAGYILWEARKMGAPAPLLARMGVNVGIDAAIGSIPLIGDIFDIGWKANRRNVRLLRRHVEATQGASMKKAARFPERPH